MIQHEEIEQATLFSWAELESGAYPVLQWLYHVPNGGLRNKRVAAKLKACGAKAGVPDVALPVARGGYIGLWIEMKHGYNKPTKEQRKWLDMLDAEGHKTAVCYSWEEARDVILEYIKLQ